MKQIQAERSWVEIDLSSFEKNLRILSGYLLPGQSFMQIVKADAYGHGAREIAEIAIALGAVYLGVANAEEGKVLRLQGIDAPILILSPSLISEIPLILRHQLSPGVSDLHFAHALSDAARAKGQTVKIHIKIDTGMHRSGIALEQAPGLYDEVASLPGLEIEGVFSHFASAENDRDFCLKQEKEFRQFVGNLEFKPRFVHIANSAALVSGYGNFCNLIRLGIASYGVKGAHLKDLALEPVMTFKSKLSQIKEIEAGETVGYQRIWKAESKSRYSIVPVGYADGYDFLLSDRAEVLVKGTLCPVIGRVSMDMITVDLTEHPDAAIADEVVLLGAGAECLRAESLSDIYQGSSYELLCQIGRRAKRYYKREGQILHSSPLARRDFVAEDYGDSKLNSIITSALTQRLDSTEIGELISKEILRSYFSDKDRDVHYRKDFHHEICFENSTLKDYYKAQTRLQYKKVLSNEFFIVACTASDEILRRFIQDPKVEYRWLLDAKLSIQPQSFVVNAVRVNGLNLTTNMESGPGYLQIRCSHPKLKDLINQELDFEINTTTLYPKSSHQFSVFITELTQGVRISFSYPDELSHLEPVSVFSGREKNPQIFHEKNTVRITSKANEWVFPLSGVVFTY